MRAFLLLAPILCIVPAPARGAEGAPCTPPNPQIDAGTVSDILTAFECGPSTYGAPQQRDSEKRLRALAAANPDKTHKGLHFITKWSSRTSTSVTYNLADPAGGTQGIELKPGQSIYLDVPPDLSNRPVRFAALGHRQDPRVKHERGWKPGEWDQHPTLTSFRIHDAKAKSETDAWRYWNGQSSGAFGAKFPEIRNVPEIEGLYEWRKWGHSGVQTQMRSNDALYPDALEIVAMSKNGDKTNDSVYVSQVTLKVLPPKPDEYLGDNLAPDGTVAFSPGTSLGEMDIETGRKYGGGQTFGGKFPGALALGGGAVPPLPKGWKVEGRELVIPVPPGKRVVSVEIAGGDSHPDGVTNSDGGSGTPGWAKLDMGIEEAATGKIDWFNNNENVPPEGVMMGSPTNCARVTQTGDKIRIRGRNDILYIMGVRIGLKNAR